MENLINLPSFVYYDKKLSELNKLQKLFLIIKGIYFIFVTKYTNGIIYCFFCNLFYKKNGKIYNEGTLYYKKIGSKKYFYPNKRISRIFVDHKKYFDEFLDTYCLNEIDFKHDDFIIDCGANVGELYFSLLHNKLKVKYLGFEPDALAFECLVRNIDDNKAYNMALSEKEETKKLFVDTEGANTSLVDFGTSTTNDIYTNRLDSFKFKNVKLLKIDAEGYEPEVLKGSKDTLNEIQYISVDYGNERGREEDSTMCEVTNFLYENKFKLISDSSYRKIGLFKNTNIKK